MLKLIRFCFYLVSVYSLNAFSQNEVDVNVFVSQVTNFYPEINVVINNNSGVEQYVIVKFERSSPITKNSEVCKPYLRDAGESYRNFLARKFFSDIGRVDRTGAVIPKKGFVHRVYVFGLNNLAYPCSMSYEVTDRNSGRIIKNGSVQLNAKTEIKGSQHEIKINDLETDYIVEKVIKSQEYSPKSEFELLTTVRVKNKTEDFFSLRLVEKRLINCTKSSVLNSILQGLDGSVMIAKPLSYAMALTLLKTAGDENPNCSLELKLQDVSESYEKNISIPLKALGEYDSMSYPLVN